VLVVIEDLMVVLVNDVLLVSQGGPSGGGCERSVSISMLMMVVVGAGTVVIVVGVCVGCGCGHGGHESR
jgi:hypothetical protein